MIVVIPVYSGDADAVRRNLEWCVKMDRTTPFKAVISTEAGFDVQDIVALAKTYFADVELFRYFPWNGIKEWPIPQNYAWRQIAKHMPELRSHWLWWESDAVPIKDQWLQKLDAAYVKNAKPFMGAWTNYQGHSYMAGVGIYPADVASYCTEVFCHSQTSFDILIGQRIGRNLAHTNLIQHVIEPVTFACFEHIQDILSPDAVLFHKCKDGSLIENLRVDPVELPEETEPLVDQSELANPHKIITLRMALDNIYGLGQFCCGFAQTLIKRGYDIRILPLNPSGPFKQVPNDLVKCVTNKITGRLITISVTTSPPLGKEPWFTLWESSNPRSEWVKTMNGLEKVIFPCKWNMECFSAAGLDAGKISQVPLALDTDFYREVPLPDGLFTFGVGGRLCHGGPRKRIEQVIAAFKDAFPNQKDVQLLVKCFPDDPGLQPTKDSRIRVIREVYTAEQMRTWYGRLHCFVTASSGEGWGLMPHSAMACGRPVIAPVYGGLAEFFDARVGLPVEYSLAQTEGPYAGLGLWCRVNQASLIEQMQYAYAHQEEMAALGCKARQRAESFNFDRSVTTFLAEFPMPLKQQSGYAKRNGSETTFYHAGDLGDVLYTLPTIIKLGGGILHLGPNVKLPDGLRPRLGITKSQFDFLAPLLRSQSYLQDVVYSPTVPNVDYDLNRFRYYWRTNEIGDWLGKNRKGRIPSLMWINLAAWKISDWNDEKSWLTVNPKQPPKPILIHRSARYNNLVFPWRQVRRKYGDNLLFIGLESEHKEWCRLFGEVDFLKVRDALEMAELIAGCKLFIGNQSFPYAIAEGIKHFTIQETWNNGPNGSDCIFDRSNAIYYRSGVLILPNIDV